MNRFHPDPHLKNEQQPLEMVKKFKRSEQEVSLFNEVTQSEEYQNATTFREQVGLIATALRNDQVRVSYQRIADLFGKNKGSIQQQIIKYMKGKKPNGRPPVLTKIEIEIIRKEIMRLHSKGYYPTYDETWDFVYLHFKKYMRLDTLRYFFQENMTDSFKLCVGVAMDELRLDASKQEIDEYYEDLEEAAEGIPLQFIFNIDECCI